MDTVLSLFLLSVLSGILALDNLQIGQFMLSRPFFAGTLLGILFGCPAEGAATGLLFDIVFSSEMPLGGSIPYNGLAGAAAAVAAVRTGSFLPEMAFFYGLIFAWTYTKADIKMREIRSAWNMRASESISYGLAYPGQWLIRSFAAEFFAMFLCVFSAGFLAFLISLRQMPIFVLNGAKFAYSVVPVLGIGILYFHFRSHFRNMSLSGSENVDSKPAGDSKNAVFNGPEHKKIKKSCFFRLFFVQGGWNFSHFQNFGFLYAIKPFLEKIYGAGTSSMNKAMLRNFEKVNTNPVMSPLLAGAVISLEKSFSEGKIREERLRQIKHSVASAAASAGDSIFWARVKPVSLQLGIFIWLLAGFNSWLFGFHSEAAENISLYALSAGPLFSVLAYSFFAVYMRKKAFEAGLSGNEADLYGLSEFPFARIRRHLSIAGFIFSSALMIEMFIFFFLKAKDERMGEQQIVLRILLILAMLAICRLAAAKKLYMPHVLWALFFAAAILSALKIPVVLF